MRSRVVLSVAVIALLLAGAVGLSASAAAAAPKAIAADDNRLDGAPAAAVMDGTGRYFIVVTGSDNSNLGQRDVFVFELLSDGTARRTAIPPPTAGPTGTAIERGRVAVAIPQGDSSPGGFAVAGPGNRVYYYEMNSVGSARWYGELNAAPVAVAVSPDNSRVVTAEYKAADLAPAQSVIRSFSANAQNGASVNEASISIALSNERVASLAFAKAASYYLVGTDKSFLYLKSDSSTKLNTYSALDSTQDNQNTVDVALSDNGAFGAAVTTNPGNGFSLVYLLNYTNIESNARSVTPATVVLSGVPTSVSLDGAGKYVAVGMANGRVALFENAPAPQAPNRELKPVGTDANVGSAVKDVAFSKDGSILLVAAGNEVAGYRVAPGMTGLGSPMWRANTNGFAVSGLGASRDGKVFGVAGVKDTTRQAFLYRQFSDVSVAPMGTSEIEITSAAGATFRMQVENKGSLFASYKLTTGGSTGWTAQLNKTTLDLAPGQVGEVNVTYVPPSLVAPGSYPVTLTATPTEGAAETATMYVKVNRFHDILLKPEGDVTRKNFQQGGPTGGFGILVENRGNIEETLTFDTTQRVTDNRAGWTATFSPPTLTLAPGGVGRVDLRLTPPRDAPSGQVNTVTVTAKGSDAYTSPALRLEATINADYRFEIVPSEEELQVPTDGIERITLKLTNTGNIVDTFQVYANVTPTSRAGQWSLKLSSNDPVELKPKESYSYTLTVGPKLRTAGPIDIRVEGRSLTGSAFNLSIPVERIPVKVDETEEQPWYAVPGFDALFLVAGLGAAALVASRRRRA